MADSDTPSSRLEVAHILMMDLVGYSRLPMADQRERLAKLNRVVRATQEFGRADAAKQLICLPTGDGMALVFFDDPEAPVRCAIEIAGALADDLNTQLRMGIHSGPVYRVEDINANLNVSGGGINLCQRVMDAGDDGHILVSSTAKELLGQIREWNLQPLGEHAVKHGLRMSLFNLCSEGVGNAEVPSKLAGDAAVAPQGPARTAKAPPRPAPPAKEKVPRPELVLPPGCSWVPHEPPDDCPSDDPEAYAKWLESRPPITIQHGDTGIDLLWVPGGSFMMGSVRGRDDEKPVRRVTVDGFWIGRIPVRARQWELVMGSVPDQYNDQGPLHPVAGVTWDEGAEFCRRIGLALPPEAYWEYAARGAEGHVYPWGSKWDASLCQCREDLHGHERTGPAGSLRGNVSWCGALDMAGNVWEWCRDWYHPNSQQAASGAATGRRSLRGGAWASDAFECRCSCRLSSAPNNRSPLIGLRVARPKAG
jgi:formylglycine-generating enzyme required for sulfatase activity/class 3 adenylate cyclase